MLDRRVPFVLALSLAAACGTPSGPERRGGDGPARARLEERLREIFDEHAFDPPGFGPAHWDGESYLAVEDDPERPGASRIVRRDLTERVQVLVPAAALVPEGATEPLAVEEFVYADGPRGGRVLVYTNSRRVWRQNTRGDYWLVDLGGGAPRLRKLGGDAPEASMMFAKLSPDGTRVGWVQASDLYVQDLASLEITRLTHDGSQISINGTSDWVYEEEFGLRDAWRWSPDGTRIAFWHFDSSEVPLFTMINDTDTLYPETTSFPHTKAGQTNSAVTIGVVAATGGEPVWMRLPGSARDHYVPRMEWVPHDGDLVLQRLDRPQQVLSVWRADPATGATREVFREEDRDAWLDVVDDWRWLPGGELLWVSERDGWRHAWAVSPHGEWRCLTPGPYDITGVDGVSAAAGLLYFTASPDDATRRYLHAVPLRGGQVVRVTPADRPGWHAYELAPTGDRAFHTVSRLDEPPVVELVTLPDHRRVRTLADDPALRARVAAVGSEVEFFRLAIAPDVELDGWMLTPRDLDPDGSYPLLVFAYNEPSAVQATDVWKGVRGMFHHALAEAGYVVACFDTQGTPGPRGRAWRKSTYKRFGPVGAAQQAAAARALMERHAFLDPERAAVWGWSGGGTMTLNLMFRHPGLYRLGMAVAPVPDVALYDSIYQERYTGLPQDDPEAYRVNSPITYAAALEGELLLMHGSADDNVHMQGTARLANLLIELGKPFDFMVYPNRSHAIKEGPGTLHHVYAHLARYLWERLPPE